MRTFIQHIADHLTHHLPQQVDHAKIQVYPGKRSVRLYYPEFESSYYEVCLKSGGKNGFLGSEYLVEIAFHFAGSPVKRASRLALFETHLPSLQPNLKYPLVVAEGARVAIQLTTDSLTETEAEQNARLMGNFLDLTYPLLRSVFENVPTRSKAPAPSTPVLNPDHYHAYAILSRHIDRVHAFLQGRASRPSDEVLCDWVHLCYTFELYREGAKLFDLIDSSAVQTGLYERARRQAKVCRLRAKK